MHHSFHKSIMQIILLSPIYVFLEQQISILEWFLIQLCITGINYILKSIKLENSYFKLV